MKLFSSIPNHPNNPSIMKKLLIVLSLLVTGSLQSHATPGTLAVDTQIPLVMDGKTVGSMTLKAGSEVSITQVLPTEDSVLISRGDSTPVKVSKEALTPESLQNAIAAEAAAATAAATPTPTPTPIPAPTASPVAVATPQPSQTPAVKLTEEEFFKKTISLIKNGDGDGHTLESYYYNPFANIKPEDITIQLKDIVGHSVSSGDGKGKYIQKNSAPLIINELIGKIEQPTSANQVAPKGKSDALSASECEALSSTNKDTWTLSTTNKYNGNIGTYPILIPNNKSNRDYRPIVINLNDINQATLQKLLVLLPTITTAEGNKVAFTGIKTERGFTVGSTTPNILFVKVYTLKPFKKGIIAEIGLPVIGLEADHLIHVPLSNTTADNIIYTPESIATALSNQRKPK